MGNNLGPTDSSPMGTVSVRSALGFMQILMRTIIESSCTDLKVDRMDTESTGPKLFHWLWPHENYGYLDLGYSKPVCFCYFLIGIVLILPSVSAMLLRFDCICPSGYSTNTTIWDSGCIISSGWYQNLVSTTQPSFDWWCIQVFKTVLQLGISKQNFDYSVTLVASIKGISNFDFFL